MPCQGLRIAPGVPAHLLGPGAPRGAWGPQPPQRAETGHSTHQVLRGPCWVTFAAWGSSDMRMSHILCASTGDMVLGIWECGSFSAGQLRWDGKLRWGWETEEAQLNAQTLQEGAAGVALVGGNVIGSPVGFLGAAGPGSSHGAGPQCGDAGPVGGSRTPHGCPVSVGAGHQPCSRQPSYKWWLL